MKSLFIKLNICACLITSCLSISAQGLSVIPSQANSDDSISVIAEVIFNKSGCHLDSTSINIIDTTIFIEAYYILGFSQGSCLSKDTIALGQLLPKHYKLKYNAIDNQTPFNPLLSDSIYFTVNQVIGISERNNPIESLSVFPNPSKEAINLKVQLDRAVFSSIKIIDAQGRIVHMEQQQLLKGESLHVIATKTFPSGIYTLSLWSEGKLLEEEKIIVQQ